MKKNIGFIGGGNMGAAIMDGIRQKYSVSVCEQDKKRCSYLKRQLGVVSEDLLGLFKRNKIIVLAIKPQGFEGLLKELGDYVTSEHVLISIAAGLSTKYIEAKLPKGMRVIRTMPNLPAQVGEGMTAVCRGKYATRSDVFMVSKLFDLVGETTVCDEKWMDAVTAVSGSGPAYVFYFVECLTKAARSLGFNEKLSKQLVMQTLRGSLALLEESEEDADILREQVTSKGGTTQAALYVLEKNQIDKVFQEALKAAAQRSKELAK